MGFAAVIFIRFWRLLQKITKGLLRLECCWQAPSPLVEAEMNRRPGRELISYSQSINFGFTLLSAEQIY